MEPTRPRPKYAAVALFPAIAASLGFMACFAATTANGATLSQSDDRPAEQSRAETAAPSPKPSPEESNPASLPKREDPIVKGVAEGGLAIVSLGFAAFTFLYTALLALKDDSSATNLKTSLRRALYATAVSVLLSAALSVVAFMSIALENPILGKVAIGASIFVLALLCFVTVSLAWSVFREGGPR